MKKKNLLGKLWAGASLVGFICLLVFWDRGGGLAFSEQETCDGAVVVPSGVYTVGSQVGQVDERPLRKIKLKAFFLDRCEVTWRRYQRCMKQGVCKDLKKKGSVPLDYPVTFVSYKEALVFCRWEKKTLPTEDQWEAAARGPEGRRYPWGDKALCEVANYGVYEDQGPCVGKNPGKPLKAGKKRGGQSPFGALDMGGNVWEWTQPSPQKTVKGEVGVLKGGSCCSMFLLPRNANRWVMPQNYRDADIGFRCVKERP